ncbi:MAG: Succinate-semialdehyde dehydrogenase (NAD(P)+) [Promethearchaeota archaeon]|nr:MAG: Succinate-semialdehyde dehydrogenase (NAD(P)+) [Candidatus Lokiarchaeota archaeon]
MNNVIKTYNPATTELVGEAEIVRAEDLPNIIERAKEAQRIWKDTPIKQRKRFLKKTMDYISANMDDIAKTIHNETGKTRIEAINNDILAGLAMIRFAIDFLEDVIKPYRIKFKGIRLPMIYMGRKSIIHPKPLGVIGIISPWNYPFGIPFSQLITSISVGNSVILKPSSETPLTGIKIQEIFENVGYPKDLIQVIPGSGSEIGSALVKSEVNRIIFTGSVSIGKKIMEMAAQNLVPVTLELGGKSPMVILNDADIERTVSGALWGSFVNAGQTCASVKRIYVQEKIYNEFIELFKEKTEKLKQGNGWDNPDIDVGPMINENALHDMEGHVAKAKEQGATILTGGEKNSILKGHFFKPTILTDLTQEMDAVCEEIFGPIVTVMPFKEISVGIKLANDSNFGLFGSVWTKNLEKGRKIALKMEMGTVSVNNHAYTYGIPHTPWHGNKNSGIGKTHGKFGFKEVMEQHHIHIDKGKFKEDPWWYPYNEERLQAQFDMNDVLFRKKYQKIFSLLGKLKKK